MKIGIIGGGISGLLSAWLLEEHFEIVLFEKSDRLGGHARTDYIQINGKAIPIDTGFEFFNDFNFPYLCRLLKILHVPTTSYSLTHTYHTTNYRDLLTLPIFQKTKIYWRSLSPANLFKLIQFKYLIIKARSFIAKNDQATTLKEFVDKLYLTQNFKENLFYPFIGSGWGDSLEEFKSFNAHNILSWIVNNEPNNINKNLWNEIVGGTIQYINALTNQLSKTTIKLSTTAARLNSNSKGYTIFAEDGNITEVDHLIIATNAYQAAKLLSQLPSTDKLKECLNKIEYFPTTIAIHGDERLMPKDKSHWSIANVFFDGTYSNLTIYKPRKSDTPLFRSWLTPNIARFNPPMPLYATEHFFHAKVNNNYFEAQKMIKDLQGKDNIWLAGIYVNGIDSHESAIRSAVTIAQQLAPNSSRLKKLLKI